MLIRDNSLTSSIIKSSDKVSEEVQLCDEPTNSGLAVTSSVSTDWSPLQLSSYNLTKPPLLKPKPSLRTETLERHPVRPLLRTFTSGRCSAEPLDSYKLTNNKTRTRSQMDAGLMVTPLPTSLSELDLRNIDPDLAASLLDQIESGADVEPILQQLRHACPSRDGGTGSVLDGSTSGSRTRDKVVTFQEDLSVQNI